MLGCSPPRDDLLDLSQSPVHLRLNGVGDATCTSNPVSPQATEDISGARISSKSCAADLGLLTLEASVRTLDLSSLSGVGSGHVRRFSRPPSRVTPVARGAGATCLAAGSLDGLAKLVKRLAHVGVPGGARFASGH